MGPHHAAVAAASLSWLCAAAGVGPGIQVIGAGVSRTGTQTLSIALTQLGFKTLHAEGFHPKISMLEEAPEIVDIVSEAAATSFLNKDFQALVPALDRIERLNVTALVDVPWSEYGVELHARYPRAKVIVTVREKQGWFRSYWQHFRWGAFLPPPPFPSFPITQPFPLTVLHQPYAQYWRLLTQRLGCGAVTKFPPWLLTESEKEACFEGFDRHAEALRKAVPAESLLIYNVREGWQPLCDFLGVAVPKTPFPRFDAYSVLHWKAGPVQFVATMRLAYGAMALLCVAFARCAFRTIWRSLRSARMLAAGRLYSLPEQRVAFKAR
mmetsp:Transcript_93165/g.268104  ORF Transcript_93165/g.268104 Transcript_93165/m.268104 type:complete len:324 (+) Transcript_93165:47-1018(+)